MENINRYGITALSRFKKDAALPGEILLHKETGEVLIKTLTGDVTSYSHNARLKNHADITTLICSTLRMTGDMGYVTFNNKKMPEIIAENANIISANDEIVLPYGTNEFLISFDIDCIDVNRETISSDTPIIKMTLSYGGKDYIIEKDITTVKSTITNIKKLIPTYTGSGIIIKDVKVHRSSKCGSGTVIRYVLNSIILITR